MTKDELWLQERAHFLRDVLAMKYIPISDDHAVDLISALRQSFVRAGHGTPAQARPLLTDFVVRRFANVVSEDDPIGPPDEVLLGKRAKPLDVRIVAATVAALIEAVRVLTDDSEMGSTWEAFSAATSFAEALGRAAAPGQTVLVADELLAGASKVLRASAESLGWQLQYSVGMRYGERTSYDRMTTAADRLAAAIGAVCS